MNKKRFYIISSTLLLIGLFAGVIQYVGMFDALYAAATNPGHSWSQMECSNILCIDTVNGRVGIGIASPEKTLEVNGNVKAGRPVGADDLTTKGYVDEKIAEVAGIITGAQPLVYGAHSQAECTTAGGEVVDSDVSYKMCKFNASSCPSGWTQYKNYNTPIATTYSCEPYEESSSSAYSSSCTTSAPGFSNGTYVCPTGIDGRQSQTFGTTCCSCYTDCSDCARIYIAFSSPKSQIGCY
ncbi:MAG: hypothetical protein PHX52_03085 [Candidatus Pacebacteria bacterium]|nr:hypothetical protein [Candidatus Paceibacterota bacterium]